jgi:hypothetical protein
MGFECPNCHKTFNPRMEDIVVTPPVKPVRLTKREHFAALAMQGMVERSAVPLDMMPSRQEQIARLSVQCSDALIRELEEVKP